MSLQAAGEGHKLPSCKNLALPCRCLDHSLPKSAKRSKVELVSSLSVALIVALHLQRLTRDNLIGTFTRCTERSASNDDFTNVVSAALHKAGSKKALLPTKSNKTIDEINLRDLTRSKRRFVVEQALEVTLTDNFYCALNLRPNTRYGSCQPRFGLPSHASHRPPRHVCDAAQEHANVFAPCQIDRN